MKTRHLALVCAAVLLAGAVAWRSARSGAASGRDAVEPDAAATIGASAEGSGATGPERTPARSRRRAEDPAPVAQAGEVSVSGGTAPVRATSGAAQNGADPSAALPRKEPARIAQIDVQARETLQPVPSIPGLSLGTIVVRDPLGLVSEKACRPGVVEIRAHGDFPSDLRFSVGVVPEGALRFDSGPLTLTRERNAAVLRVRGGAAGAAVLQFTLLDAAGRPTSTQLSQAVGVQALATLAEPVVAVALGPVEEYGPGLLRGTGLGSIAGVRGSSPATILAGRSEFRDFGTRATELVVTAEDPSGILEEFPASLTIPAGARFSPTARVRLRDVEGEATLRFRGAGTELTMPVRSVTLHWRAPAQVVVPAGATAHVAFAADPACLRLEQIEAALDRTEVADLRVVTPSAKDMFPPGFGVEVSGRLAGSARLSASVAARPAASVDVVVVEEEVLVSRTSVTLRGVSAAAGSITLTAPAGSRWVRDPQAAIPASVAGVDGVGTAKVTIRLAGAAGAPQDVEIPLRIDGDFVGPVRVGVADGVHRPVRAPYSTVAK